MGKIEFARYAAVHRCSTACSMTVMKHHRIVGTVYTCGCLRLRLFTLVAFTIAAVYACGCLHL